jgi:hypothetical protein
MTFFERLKLAWAVLFGAALPQPPPAPASLPAPAPAPAAPTPAARTPLPTETHAAALHLLGLLQREGRLVDFVREDVSAFSDAEVGAAARAVHQGCKKVLEQYLVLTPARSEAEGANIEVAVGYDANRVRLTGNVTGAGPWRGALRHHGWAVSEIKLPPVPTAVDVAVLAPAEVELP